MSNQSHHKQRVPKILTCLECGATHETELVNDRIILPPCPKCGANRSKAKLTYDEVRPYKKGISVIIPGSIVVQALVTLDKQNPDGRSVEAVLPAWFELNRLLSEYPDILYAIAPTKMEELIAAAYKKAGFDVILTPRSGDHGRDIIATKTGRFSIRIIDQIKAYSPEHLVTANDVRALLGVLHSDHAATKGVVTTTSDFAPRIADDPLIKPHVPYRLELVNKNGLLKWLNSLQDESAAGA